MSRNVRSSSDATVLENQARINANVLRLISGIPRRRVSTYGALAEALDLNPRRVARVLSHDPRSVTVPWHRVVGNGGRLAITRVAGKMKQARLLRREGIEVANDRVKQFRAVFFRP